MIMAYSKTAPLGPNAAVLESQTAATDRGAAPVAAARPRGAGCAVSRDRAAHSNIRQSTRLPLS